MNRSAHPPIDPEFFDSVTASASDLPERRLMAAVLFDAVLQLARRGSKGAADAARWIRDRNDDDSPFSFSSVCYGLGLDPEYLARGLLTWDPTALENGQTIPTRRSLAVPRRRKVALRARRRRSSSNAVAG